MKPNTRFAFSARALGLALLVAASSVFAADSYLANSHLDATILLADPPLAGSEEQKADMACVVSVFHARSHDEEAAALHEQNFDKFLFAPVIGPVFAPGKLPVTEALLTEVEKESKAVTKAAKDHWKRPRHCMVDTNLDVGEPETSPSYPSGHSTGGTLDALVLAEIFPAKRDAIVAYGRDMGWHRVLIAKHYPTDIYAGRVLGQALFRELMANPAFVHDLDAAKAEAAKAEH